MKIECYLSPSCSSEYALRLNIAEALRREGFQAVVEFQKIDEALALAIGVSGSPAVFIDGREIQPLQISGFA